MTSQQTFTGQITVSFILDSGAAFSVLHGEGSNVYIPVHVAKAEEVSVGQLYDVQFIRNPSLVNSGRTPYMAQRLQLITRTESAMRAYKAAFAAEEEAREARQTAIAAAAAAPVKPIDDRIMEFMNQCVYASTRAVRKAVDCFPGEQPVSNRLLALFNMGKIHARADVRTSDGTKKKDYVSVRLWAVNANAFGDTSGCKEDEPPKAEFKLSAMVPDLGDDTDLLADDWD